MKKTKLIVRILLFAGTVVSLYFVPWIIVWAWISPLPDTIQEQVDEAVSLGFDGVIVYIDQGGKDPKSYASGWHDREKTIPAYPEALFKIASISKLYDAVSITKLVHNKQLSLDKTLAEYFPEIADRIEYSDEITLQMMVQHRSGIPNFTDTPGYWVNPPQTTEGNLELVLDQPAYFKPGEDYGYSNTNYLLIGELIEKTVGYSKHQYITEKILLPLNLSNTFSSLSEVNIDSVMSGRYVGYSEDLKFIEQGMLATAADVGKFLRALNDGSLLKKGEQEIYSAIYEYEHGGLVPGYQSLAKYDGNTDAVVVLFMNTTNFQGYEWNLMQVVHDRLVRILEN